MRKKTALVALAIVLAIMTSTNQPVLAQQPSLNVVYYVDLSSHFGIYTSTPQRNTISVSGDVGSTTTNTTVKVDFQFSFDSLQGLSSGANYSITVISQHPLVSELKVVLPPGTGHFDFSLTGSSKETSFAYRTAATITFVNVSMSAAPFLPTSYQVLIPTSPRFEVVSIFPGTGPGVTTQEVTINGTSYIATGFSYAACFVISCSVAVGANTISVIYQPAYFNYFIVVYVALAVAILVGAGLILRGGGRGLPKLLEWAKGTVDAMMKVVDSKKILAVLVGVSVFMVSVAFVFGPSPAPRAYLAATPQTAQTLEPYISGAGYTYLTPNQAGDEFDVMSGLGSYYVVIVADYPPPLQSAGFASNYRIIAISPYANATLVNNLQAFYGHAVTVVNSPQQLQFVLGLEARGYTSNHIGLPVSGGTYSAVTVFVGLLSLTIPFFALAFFARYLVESSSKGIVKLAQAAAFSFFIFMFGELVFIQTDVLLGLPVALHATISSQETAIGALGFGGGSRPRMVLGILGFLFGAVVGSVRGTKVDRVVLVGVLSAFAFLLVDPLILGQDFYNLLLQVLTSQGGTAFGQASYTGLRSFIQIFMDAFGNNVVPTFFSQHGAVLFFAGAIPFALYTYVRRSTATLLLFFSAVVAGLGYVRIGDQDPLKAIASTTPGFAMAVLFVVAFLLSDRAERFLRHRLGLG